MCAAQLVAPFPTCVRSVRIATNVDVAVLSRVVRRLAALLGHQREGPLSGPRGTRRYRENIWPFVLHGDPNRHVRWDSSCQRLILFICACFYESPPSQICSHTLGVLSKVMCPPAQFRVQFLTFHNDVPSTLLDAAHALLVLLAAVHPVASLNTIFGFGLRGHQSIEPAIASPRAGMMAAFLAYKRLRLPQTNRGSGGRAVFARGYAFHSGQVTKNCATRN